MRTEEVDANKLHLQGLFFVTDQVSEGTFLFERIIPFADTGWQSMPSSPGQGPDLTPSGPNMRNPIPPSQRSVPGNVATPTQCQRRGSCRWIINSRRTALYGGFIL